MVDIIMAKQKQHTKRADTMGIHILVADNEKEETDVISAYLANDGYIIHKFYTGVEALACIENTDLDLAILDASLPDIDGFQICQKIRKTFYYPIIMLSERTDDYDKIMGLAIGADDYMTKPFTTLEIAARVKTLLRRYMHYNNLAAKPHREIKEYCIRGLIINQDNHKCFLFGKELHLTPIEFSILWYLCEHQGIVISSEELFESIWGERALIDNNTVMAHIGRLREKMREPARNPKFIKTVWGVGYTIEK